MDRDPIDDLLAKAGRQPAVASPDFLARILDDADRIQTLREETAQPPAPIGRNWLSRLSAALGGAIAVAGVGTAAMAGLVVGYVQPDALVSFADSYNVVGVSADLDLIPGYETLYLDEVSQ